MAAPCFPVGLDVADDASTWASCGFRIEEGSLVRLGEVTIRLVGRQQGRGATKGIVGWSFQGLPSGASTASVDGIPCTPPPTAAASPESVAHPNGATHVDHIVLRSPEADRTIQRLAEVGIHPIREQSTVRQNVRQVIFRPSTAIIELVQTKNTAKAPPHIWGLTLVTGDVDQTHAFLDKTTKAPWPAVQPGRRMTVVDHKAHGMSVAMAFMSPHVAGLEGTGEERLRLFEVRARAQETELKKRQEAEDIVGSKKAKL